VQDSSEIFDRIILVSYRNRRARVGQAQCGARIVFKLDFEVSHSLEKGRLIRYSLEKGLSERLLAGLQTLYGEERIRDEGVLASEAKKRSLQLF
jgi:hypothetical protein